MRALRRSAKTMQIAVFRFILGLLAFTLLSACNKNGGSKVAAFFITSEGHFPIDRGAFVNVSKTENGLLNVAHHVDGSHREWTKGVIDPNSSWFVYVERRNEAWIVFGDTAELVFDRPKEGGTVGLFSCAQPGRLNQTVLHQMPVAVKERLPLKLRQRIEEAGQAGSGQPATRFQLESEGSDKPKPEAEGRSR